MDAAGLKKGLQNKDSGHPIDSLGAFLNAQIRFPQHAIGFRGSEPFIPEMHRKLEFLPKLFGKLGDFFRLSSFCTAHPQRIAQDDLAHIVPTNNFAKPEKIVAPVLALQGLDALGSDPQRVRNSQSHAAGAVIDGQDTSRSFHLAIIWGKCILTVP
jgi:hypothetical protein